MSLLKRIFGRLEEKEKHWEPVDYKNKIIHTMEADEDPQWLRDILLGFIEKKEKSRTNEEMVLWLENWLREEKLPEDFLNEEFLIRVYHEDPEMITEMFQLQCSVIFNGSPSREMIEEQYGEQIAKMSSEAVKAYLGLLFHFHNVLALSEFRKK